MSIKDKYIACLVLHAVGDTIGFNNGKWEFNENKDAEPEYSNTLLYEFIALGGIIGIDLKNWIVSDDTVMHLDTGNALVSSNDIASFCIDVSNRYVSSLDNMKGRYIGNTIKNNLLLIKNKVKKWNEIPYNEYYGGSGGSMRTSCIGLAFHGKENLSQLIAYSIEASRITNNSVIGYLGGLVSALFTAYAIENISIEKWPFKLIKLLESDKIDKYIEKTRDYDNYLKHKEQFVDFWKKYIELRFVDGKFIYKRIMTIPSYRSTFFINNFAINKKIGPGGLGHDSVIIAYDALVSAKNRWETLVVYSTLHVGDSDSTGCIAASWFGAVYGFHNVPLSNYKYLEYRDSIINLANKIYDKYKNI